jgi:hypothetical protein
MEKLGVKLSAMKHLIDLAGQRFGRLTVVSYGKNAREGWFCRCDCGVEWFVPSGSLRNGSTRSCGCLKRDEMSQRLRTHGGAFMPEYKIWEAMRRRCSKPSDPSYKNYGARGISVCERWLDYGNFLADMGKRPTPKHTLDRTNNDGNYEPGNCHWATRSEQAKNRRFHGFHVHPRFHKFRSQLSHYTPR